MDVSAFIAKWAASSGAERANKDPFLIDLCEVLDVPRPNPTTGRPEKDTYVFEKDALRQQEGGAVTVGKIDLYKEGCFILEAKQGSDEKSHKLGTAKRGTPGWNIAMMSAYGQALGYARSFDKPVPFLIVCDIGYCFDLYAAFDGSYSYSPFPNAKSSRIYLTDLEKPEHRDTLRRIFLDPYGLDPSRYATKVTREVAEKLAELAKKLEDAGHPSESVAQFLMRCIFTMFAEDVGLLPEKLFTRAIEERWIPNPRSFPGGIENLWRTMNQGGAFGFVDLLHFNGGMFANPAALPLKREHLQHLLEAANHDWAEVEPAIFGTLIERALDPKERHALGAHYTPRAYVERLVRPTIEEPLRADWELVQAEVRELVANDKIAQAKKRVRDFHRKLCETKVLDPACGSGNFLYVTLDLFKRLEGEILSLLEALGEKQTLLHADTIRVTPAQFLGIEIKPWAKEIAELVLWIGYLQHHFRTYGRAVPPPQPVLQDYKNIERRDAILAWDDVELVRDETGKPITRWDGETYKKHPVTGENVPDENARVPVYRYINPRKAEWPKADFIVGNPPFLGNKRMRAGLGDGYVEALRKAWPEVPESADYVMYWWHHAATLTANEQARRAGLITTNSIVHPQSRRVVQRHLEGSQPLSLVFAIPDHPWVDSANGADVRIAMTVVEGSTSDGVQSVVVAEERALEGTVSVTLRTRRGRIRADLTCGANVVGATPLKQNQGMSFMGVTLVGEGFRIDDEQLAAWRMAPSDRPPVVRPFLIGRDLAQRFEQKFVIDLFGLNEAEVKTQYPVLYQHVLTRVRPAREQNKRKAYRDKWWIFGEPRGRMREALKGLRRFIATPETSKYRFFTFLDESMLADHSLFVIALDDAFYLGVLSSRPHVLWALAAGSRLGVGNDPRYRNNTCFDPFPFPSCTDAQADRIRQLAESLDAHRKRQQALYPDLTITGMYNVLEKLRKGEPLSAKEKVIHEQGLVSVLKQIHDELDAAVFDAYGWPHDLSDEEILEKLVALNAERAEEERRGIVRWLRPDFQNPSGKKEATQVALDTGEEETPEEAPKTAPSWPKKLPEQVALVRDLLSRNTRTGFAVRDVAKAFKGAKAKEVEVVLESLGALGIAVSYEKDGERRWLGAGRGGV